MRTGEKQCLSVGLAGLLLLSPGGTPSVQAQGQHAGEVTAQIPQGHIERVSGSQAAEVGTEVLWQDLLRTEPRGRVRVALGDGSILNVGSNAQLRVIQHDASTRQTNLTLALGQLRARLVKLTQKNARFEVRTNTAVVGVIGTDFWLLAEPTRTVVIVYEGAVRVSHINAAIGGSVRVFAGQRTVVPLEQPPQPPAPPGQAEFQASLDETSVGPELPRSAPPRPAVAGRKKWPWIVAIVGGAAALAIALAVRGGHKAPPPTAPPTEPPQ